MKVDRATVEPVAVGASEVGAVLGCDPYTTPLQLYRRKLGLDPAVEDNDAMRLGRALEGPIVDLLRPRLLEPIRRNRVTFAMPDVPLFATPDAFVGYGRVLEVKVVGTWLSRDWDDAVPCRVLLQVQAQLLVTGRQAAYVAALVGSEIRLTSVQADPVVQDAIVGAVTAFADRLAAGLPPDPLTYDERWQAVVDELSQRAAGDVRLADGPLQDAGRAILRVREERERLDDEERSERLVLAAALVDAGEGTRLVANDWTATVQATKSGTTIVVRRLNR